MQLAPATLDAMEGSGEGFDGFLGEGDRDDDLEARHILAQVRRRLAGVDDAAATIGRYQIREQVGTGAMGVVYSAFDPELARPVALKLLRLPTGRARARMLREARALAQLSHPNVIAVYDVLTEGEQVCLAMELIAGVDLSQWMKTSHPLSEILEVFIAAGRGLHAAHVAGLVHRDFKPANVMLAHDGRVRVLDFGLVRGELESEAEPRPEGPAPADLSVTLSGTTLGTPAYMAPEQVCGRVADARADQFAFCVALHEAIVGARPFVAPAPLKYLELVEAGLPGSPPRRSIPAPLWAALRRGLSARADARFDDVDALLRSLAPPRRSRWPWIVGGTLGLGVVGILAARGPDAQACEAGDVAGVWTEERRDALTTAFEATGARHAREHATRVGLRLDEWSAAWNEARTHACQLPAGTSRSTDALGCLDLELARAGALADALLLADAHSVNQAVQASAGLSNPMRCIDPVAARARVGPPIDPEVAAEVTRIREFLERAWALERTGHYDNALALAQHAAEQADALGFDPLRGEARRVVGTVFEQLGRVKDANAALTEAHFIAEASGHDDLAVRTIAELVFNVGAMQGDFESAQEWYRHAEARLGRDSVDPYAEAMLRLNYGSVLYAAGRYDEALESMTRAQSMVEAILGPEDFRAGTCEVAIGSVLLAQGRWQEAIVHQERALAIQTATLGPQNPLIGDTHIVLGGAYIGLQDDARADEHTRIAVEIKAAAYGTDSPYYADALLNRAILVSRLGRHADAVDLLSTAVSIYEALPGDAAFYANALDSLGLEEQAVGAVESAETHMRRSIDVRRRTRGPDHWEVWEAHADLAAILRDAGKLEEAQQTAAAAVEHLDADPDCPSDIRKRARDLATETARALGPTG